MNLKHWETTALGSLVILVTLAHAAFTYILTKQLPDLTITVSGLAVGIGLIRTPDAKNVDAAIAELKGQFGQSSQSSKKG